MKRGPVRFTTQEMGRPRARDARAGLAGAREKRTFELFRRDSRNVEILTNDESYLSGRNSLSTRKTGDLPPSLSKSAWGDW